ncbi:hypothetical protein [Neorhodopirellula pilleata]
MFVIVRVFSAVIVTEPWHDIVKEAGWRRLCDEHPAGWLLAIG